MTQPPSFPNSPGSSGYPGSSEFPGYSEFPGSSGFPGSAGSPGLPEGVPLPPPPPGTAEWGTGIPVAQVPVPASASVPVPASVYAPAGGLEDPGAKRKKTSLLLALITGGVALLVVVGVVLWLVLSGGSQEEFDQAMQDLRDTIASSEVSLSRAQEATLELTAEAEVWDDQQAAELVVEAESSIVAFEAILNSGKEVLKAAESEAKPSRGMVKELEEATEALDEVVTELDVVTDEVEESVQELQGRMPVMNLEQIAAGDYSSIVGRWESSRGDYLEITDSVIDQYEGGELLSRLTGLTLTNMAGTQDLPAGQIYERYTPVEGDSALAWEFYYAPPNVPGAHSAKALVAFFEADSPFDVDPYFESRPSDESEPRIVFWAQNMFGRGYFTEDYFDDYLFYWVGPLADASGEDSPGAGANSTSESAGCVAPVEGAYPCAGGPIPEGAQPLTVFTLNPDHHGGIAHQVGKAKTPSDNIVCSAEPDEVVCVVHSWDSSEIAGYVEEQGGAGGVTLKVSGPAQQTIHSGAPLGFSAHGSDVLAYGTVRTYGDFVFASEENGLTFWNANSGYGAFINRSGFYPFGPR